MLIGIGKCDKYGVIYRGLKRRDTREVTCHVKK